MRYLIRIVGIIAGIFAVTSAELSESAIAVPVPVELIGLVCAGVCVLAALGDILRASTQIHWRIGSALFLVVSLTSGLLLADAQFLRFRTIPIVAESSGATLSGTLYIPSGVDATALVVVVHGSGPQTRDDIYTFLAKYFARRGIAAVAYDKRGSGLSTGKLGQSNYVTLAQDVSAIISSASSARGLKDRTVGVVGISEGGWVAPIAASADDRITFVATIGGTALTPANQVRKEIEIRLRNRRFGDADIQEALTLNDAIRQYERTGEKREETQSRINRSRNKQWFSAAKKFPEELGAPDEYQWWRGVMDFDPMPYWQKLNSPTLFIKGEADDRSNAMEDRKAFQAVMSAPNQMHCFKTFPNADHALLHWPIGTGTPPPIFATGYPAIIVQGVLAASKGRSEFSRFCQSNAYPNIR